MKKYIVNQTTKEIHKEKDLTIMCNINPEKHPSTCWFGAMFRIWFCGYDGCAWCMKKHNRG